MVTNFVLLEVRTECVITYCCRYYYHCYYYFDDLLALKKVKNDQVTYGTTVKSTEVSVSRLVVNLSKWNLPFVYSDRSLFQVSPVHETCYVGRAWAVSAHQYITYLADCHCDLNNSSDVLCTAYIKLARLIPMLGHVI
jgi:hypothetical protein